MALRDVLRDEFSQFRSQVRNDVREELQQMLVAFPQGRQANVPRRRLMTRLRKCDPGEAPPPPDIFGTSTSIPGAHEWTQRNFKSFVQTQVQSQPSRRSQQRSSRPTMSLESPGGWRERARQFARSTVASPEVLAPKGFELHSKSPLKRLMTVPRQSEQAYRETVRSISPRATVVQDQVAKWFEPDLPGHIPAKPPDCRVAAATTSVPEAPAILEYEEDPSLAELAARAAGDGAGGPRARAGARFQHLITGWMPRGHKLQEPWRTSSGDEYDIQKDFWMSGLLAFVLSPCFDFVTCGFVILNAIFMGVQTDWQARNLTSSAPQVFGQLERVFCVFFTLELVLRMLAHGRSFFSRPVLIWHLFDSVLVASQLFEQIAAAASISTLGLSSNLGLLRTLRVLRLIRVVRLMRVLRLIGELRTLVMSIVGSLRSLVWAVLLLFMMMYIIGVYLTQLVLDARTDIQNADGISPLLADAYGSLGSTIYSLFQAVTGGQNWGDLVTPLQQHISGAVVPLFMVYIAFTTLCMMNVVTGVFVESALLTARKDKDIYMVNHVRTLFHTVDLNDNGAISWSEFSLALDTPEMQEVFRQIDIDISEAKGLFHLLDINGTGQVDADEFVSGCNRLRGPAKALDLTLLMRETMRLSERHQQHSRMVERQLKWISDFLLLSDDSCDRCGYGTDPGLPSGRPGNVFLRCAGDADFEV